MYSTIEASLQDGCLVIRFARPDVRNALSRQLLDEVREACRSADTDGDVRTVVITGGPEVFSSGADLREALSVNDPGTLGEYLGHFRELNAALESLAKPVIAAINGPCLTGGLELALACDIRVADASARFAITSARIGSVAGAGGTQRLPRVIGLSAALELLLLAEPIDAETALRIGLIHRLVATGEALPASLGIAATLAQRAPISLALTKRAARQGVQLGLDDGLDLEFSLVREVFQTRDRTEGMSAFLDKRPPSFEGR